MDSHEVSVLLEEHVEFHGGKVLAAEELPPEACEIVEF